VCFGLADGRRTRTLRCRFFGDRRSIKIQAAQTALDWLRRYLLVRNGNSPSTV
jgi:nicotinamide mononucleotide (NMN) deamidase PncC